MCLAPSWALQGQERQIGSSSNSSPGWWTWWHTFNPGETSWRRKIFELGSKSCQASKWGIGQHSQSWLWCCHAVQPWASLSLSVFTGTTGGRSRGFWASGLTSDKSAASLSSQVATFCSARPHVHSMSNLLVTLRASQGWTQSHWAQVFLQLGHLGHASLIVMDPLLFELANIFEHSPIFWYFDCIHIVSTSFPR